MGAVCDASSESVAVSIVRLEACRDKTVWIAILPSIRVPPWTGGTAAIMVDHWGSTPRSHLSKDNSGALGLFCVFARCGPEKSDLWNFVLYLGFSSQVAMNCSASLFSCLISCAFSSWYRCNKSEASSLLTPETAVSCLSFAVG